MEYIDAEDWVNANKKEFLDIIPIPRIQEFYRIMGAYTMEVAIRSLGQRLEIKATMFQSISDCSGKKHYYITDDYGKTYPISYLEFDSLHTVWLCTGHPRAETQQTATYRFKEPIDLNGEDILNLI